ncbi:GNAT family N-acetyltransferase [Streptomyces massasporeus]|uniref:GNAT family N-acetyltransferase n=1 Tax=Streptomyces massasporeus TaxID=67324 RepID=UPI0033DA29A3
MYLYKLIVARAASGRQLGTRLIDWMSRLAALEGRTWVRIDTWRTNTGLHDHYERLGFERVRTELRPTGARGGLHNAGPARCPCRTTCCRWAPAAT